MNLEKTDGGRRYRSKQQDAEVLPVSGISGSLEELEKAVDRETVLVPVQQSVQTTVSDQEDATTFKLSSFYPMENCPPNQILLQNQHSYFPVPPSSSWSLQPPPPLPPRPPFVDNSTLTSVTATQGNPWLQLQPNQLSPRPSLHMGDFNLNPLSMVNTMSQPFGGPSFAQGNISLQHVLFKIIHTCSSHEPSMDDSSLELIVIL